LVNKTVFHDRVEPRIAIEGWIPVRTEVDAGPNLQSSVPFDVDFGVSFRHVRYWKFRLDS
jgi:hypothetical protein